MKLAKADTKNVENLLYHLGWINIEVEGEEYKWSYKGEKWKRRPLVQTDYNDFFAYVVEPMRKLGFLFEVRYSGVPKGGDRSWDGKWYVQFWLPNVRNGLSWDKDMLKAGVLAALNVFGIKHES